MFQFSPERYICCDQPACIGKIKGCGGRVTASSAIKIAREAGYRTSLILILAKLDYYHRFTTLDGDVVYYQGENMAHRQALPRNVSKINFIIII